MTEEHYIEFIVVETNRNIYMKRLQPEDKPQASFILNDEDVVSTVAYCNLHGLWNS
jgi:superoxide reductase